MAGYYNFSMSNNAVEAYSNGEMPLSKWTKAEIISEIEKQKRNGEIEINFDIKLAQKLPVAELKEMVLSCSSWHHTSSRYNRTDFYSVDVNRVEALTNEEIKDRLETVANKSLNSKDKIENVQMAECSFLDWGGTRKHPKAKEITEIGEIRGNWFYRSDGTKKSIKANGFRIIKTFSEGENIPIQSSNRNIVEESYTNEKSYTMREIIEKYHLPVEYRTPKDGREIAIVTFPNSEKRAYQIERLDICYYFERNLPLEEKPKPSVFKQVENIKSEQKNAARIGKTAQKQKKNVNQELE